MAETDPDDRDRSRAAWVKAVGLFGVIVADIVGYTGAGLAIGYLCWTKLGFPFWFLLIPGLAGFGLSMYRLYQLSQKL